MSIGRSAGGTGGVVRWFRTVRWPDGRVASYGFDRIARFLRPLEFVLLAMFVLLWSRGAHVAFVVAAIALALAAACAARWRLERAVRDAVCQGRVPGPAESRNLYQRLVDYALHEYAKGVDKFTARAEEASQRGDERRAQRYREKANKCIERAQRSSDASDEFHERWQ